MPVVVGFAGDLDGRCPTRTAWRSGARPAAQADEVLLGTGLTGTLQVDLDCVLQAYSSGQLTRYAAEGDPLANYALALKASLVPGFCQQREELVRKLTIAAEAAPDDALRKRGFYARRRFPDAMFVIYQIQTACGSAEAGRALVFAQYYGYAPAFMVQRIEEPIRPPGQEGR